MPTNRLAMALLIHVASHRIIAISAGLHAESLFDFYDTWLYERGLVVYSYYSGERARFLSEVSSDLRSFSITFFCFFCSRCSLIRSRPISLQVLYSYPPKIELLVRNETRARLTFWQLLSENVPWKRINVVVHEKIPARKGRTVHRLQMRGEEKVGKLRGEIGSISLDSLF